MIRIEALTADHAAATLASVHIYVDVEDAALLPKGARINPRTRQADIEFRGNDVNGGTNETGAKRVKSLLKAADRAGIGVVFAQPCSVKDELNAPFWGVGMRYITRDALEALLG